MGSAMGLLIERLSDAVSVTRGAACEAIAWTRRTLLVATMTLACPTFALAAEIRLMSTNAMTDAMHELAPLFEQATGHKLVMTFEPTNLIIERLKRGEAADLVMLVKANLDDLANAGQVSRDTVADIARTRIGVAVREGGKAIDISTMDAFKASLLSSRSVALSRSGASGIQFVRALERHRISDALTARLTMLDGAARAGDAVTRGDAEIGVQMVSELAPIPGLKVYAPLPGDFNFEITVAAGVMVGSRSSTEAAELIRFAASPKAAQLLAAKGLEPI
jgi:molybdate transport system substrate-binding protein